MYLNKLGLEGLDCVEKAQNWDGSWAVMNTAMNLLVS